MFEEAAVLDGVVAAEDAGDGFGVGAVLFEEDAGGEGFGGVVVEDLDGALEDDDAVVDALVDEVDGAAGDFGAEFEGLGLGVETGEAGEQAGVDVEDAVGEGLDEGRGDDAHVAGEADEVDPGAAQALDELFVTLDGHAASDGNVRGGQAEGARGGEAGGVGFVREHDGDFGLGQAAIRDGLVDGEEVGAATGEQDAKTFHLSRIKRRDDDGLRLSVILLRHASFRIDHFVDFCWR